MSVDLVTGGSGYFGSLLVQRLVEHGRRVRILDLNDATDRPDGVEFVRADIRDRAAVDRAVQGVGRVFHNVAQVPLSNDPRLLRSVNVDGTQTLLDAARDAAVDKVVHTSSSAVFGVPAENPVLPTTIPKPAEPYGHAKLAAEWACLDAARSGLDVSIVRPRTILGHGRLGIFGILFDWVADGAAPIVLGDGGNRYQFVHANDLADACILAADRPGTGLFNIGAEHFGSMFETLDALCRHAGTGSTVRRLPAAPATIAMRASARLRLTPFAPYHWLMYGQSMWFDIDHARRELGWKPRWSTDEMFAETYDWFVEHRDSVRSRGASTHRRSARQGVLAVAKHVAQTLPRARSEAS